jgi:hypothetical protein
MHYAHDYGDIKALSMNLMDSNTRITDGTYAILSHRDTHERVSGFGESGVKTQKSGANGEQEVVAKLRDLLIQLESL